MPAKINLDLQQKGRAACSIIREKTINRTEVLFYADVPQGYTLQENIVDAGNKPNPDSKKTTLLNNLVKEAKIKPLTKTKITDVIKSANIAAPVGTVAGTQKNIHVEILAFPDSDEEHKTYYYRYLFEGTNNYVTLDVKYGASHPGVKIKPLLVSFKG